MNQIGIRPQKIKKWFEKTPERYLLLGVVLMVFAHLSYNVAFAAWICMVPFLVYLKQPIVRFKWLKFITALLVAWSLIVLKIITGPIPVFLVFMYSLPITLIHLPAYILWSKLKVSKRNMFLFPSIMVVMEWLQYSFTPLGSWGSLAYTQEGHLAIMQTLSVFGMAGLSFIVYLLNVWIAGLWMGNRAIYSSYIWILSLLFAVCIYGEIRLDYYSSTSKNMLTVAAIGTDSEAGGLPLPDFHENHNDFRKILNRTEQAAEAGAELVVWNEAAFITEPRYEAFWVDSMRSTARQAKVKLVASYVNVTSTNPFRYENKYHFINEDGEVEFTYNKHEPVPGEPTTKGQEDLAVSELGDMKIGGAICYDYDFPYIARGFGKLQADLVCLPSSDWRGIDPLHTRMAAFRAVEQGHSVLRSTRFGLSAAIDPVGEFRAQMSSFDSHNGIMIAQLPKKKAFTLYGLIGDVFVVLCIAYLGVVALNMILRKKA